MRCVELAFCGRCAFYGGPGRKVETDGDSSVPDVSVLVNVSLDINNSDTSLFTIYSDVHDVSRMLPIIYVIFVDLTL